MPNKYVDGFVIPIKRKNLPAYKKMAQMGCKAWMKHGALSYYECVIDDFTTHGLGFRKMCKLKPGETAIFAFIVFRSKADRNRINAKVMKEMDEQMAKKPMKMPFDMKRFSWAGCKALVHAK